MNSFIVGLLVFCAFFLTLTRSPTHIILSASIFYSFPCIVKTVGNFIDQTNNNTDIQIDFQCSKSSLTCDIAQLQNWDSHLSISFEIIRKLLKWSFEAKRCKSLEFLLIDLWMILCANQFSHKNVHKTKHNYFFSLGFTINKFNYLHVRQINIVYMK